MTSFLALVRDGKLELLDKQGWRECLSKYKGKQISIRIETPEERRSSQANRYWWGVVVEFFREQWSRERSVSYSPEQVHDVLARVLLGEEEGPMGHPVRRATSTLKTAEFHALTEKARELAWQTYQSRIPEPGEMDL